MYSHIFAYNGHKEKFGSMKQLMKWRLHIPFEIQIVTDLIEVCKILANKMNFEI